jgi:two-component system, OmpR family, sensor kinase
MAGLEKTEVEKAGLNVATPKVTGLNIPGLNIPGLNVTLRLRLTLFYTLLVAVVLALSGLGLHLLLRRNLYQSLDNSLHESVSLLNSLTVDPGETLKLRDEDGALRLPSDLTALLFDPAGTLLDSLGRVPQAVPAPALGFSSWQEWRVYGEVIQGRTLLVMRDVERVEESLRQFTSSFLFLLPLAVLLAFGLGYALAGRALNPVTSLTKAAYDLAQRRAWREVLPEPTRQDEVWQLARATNTLLGTLANVIETERRFTADAAHELRTPLTVLRGRLEQALEQSSEPKIQTMLSKSLTATDTLLGLTEKLLLLARTEAGQGLTLEALSLDAVALEVAESLQSLFSEKGLRLRLELPENAVAVMGDRIALGLAIKNLLENALKFTPSGEVRLQLETKDNQAVLAVLDTGPGIPADSLPQLFERFYQTDVKHRRTGSGLGLAIVKSIVLWHGGSVHAENRTDGDVGVDGATVGGARVWLELPLAKAKGAGVKSAEIKDLIL